jgi:transposase-like protein
MLPTLEVDQVELRFTNGVSFVRLGKHEEAMKLMTLLRKIRWARLNRVTCMYCHSQNIKKNGCYRSYQKFYCKCCKKNDHDSENNKNSKEELSLAMKHLPNKSDFILL